jgi:hypothetical protein
MLLRDLINLPLPRIESLSAQDIVDVREDSTFKGFRRDLKHTLEQMAAIPIGFNREAGQFRVFNDEMKGARDRLDRRLQHSSFLTAARKGVENFAIGFIASLPFDPKAGVTSLATGAATAALTMLRDYLGGRSSKAQQALMHHFLVMEAGPPKNIAA